MNYIPNTQFTGASILLSNECNLACAYCYNLDDSRYDGQPSFMSTDMAEKCIDFLIQGALVVKEKQNNAGINLMLFGGEPTMNAKVIKDMIEYGCIMCEKAGLSFKAQLITNCTIWNDDIEDMLNSWLSLTGMVDIQLSIDGCPEVIDHNRKSKDSSTSTSVKILETAKKYIEWRDKNGIDPKSIHVHGCISKFSLPLAKRSYDYIRDIIGFDRIWFMPIHEDTWDDEDINILEEQYKMIADRIYTECIDKKTSKYLDDFSSFEVDVPKGNLPCGAGTNFLTFDTDGTIYPCHKFKYPKEKKMVLGHIDKGIDPEVLSEFEGVTMKNFFGVNNCDDCPNKNCKICMAQNYDYNGDIRQGFPKYCQLALKEDEIRWELRRRLIEANLVTGGVKSEILDLSIMDKLDENIEPTNSFDDLIKNYLKNSLEEYTILLDKDLVKFKDIIVNDTKYHQEVINNNMSMLNSIITDLVGLVSKISEDINKIKDKNND